MDKISAYNKEMHSFLSQLDVKFSKAARHHRDSLLHDYQMWLRQRDKEFAGITERVTEKLNERTT